MKNKIKEKILKEVKNQILIIAKPEFVGGMVDIVTTEIMKLLDSYLEQMIKKVVPRRKPRDYDTDDYKKTIANFVNLGFNDCIDQINTNLKKWKEE